MHCPFCAHEETKVIDSRLAAEGQQMRRRRECLPCGERFTTFESAELVMPRVVKSDATREPFDEAKLRAGMLKALEKRPVSSEAIDAAVNHICHQLRTLGEREVPSRLVGELVMDELRHLDEVAYVRFASVYRSFQDVDAFREEIERLRHRRPRTAEDVQLPLWSQAEAGGTQEVTMFSADDHRHMARALELARRGLYSTPPNPRVGCVLVRGGAGRRRGLAPAGGRAARRGRRAAGRPATRRAARRPT